jgi:hypothetical protein
MRRLDGRRNPRKSSLFQSARFGIVSAYELKSVKLGISVSAGVESEPIFTNGVGAEVFYICRLLPSIARRAGSIARRALLVIRR